MKKLYFDNNIVIDIKNLRNKSLLQIVNSLEKEKYQIVFSPAHIEEIAGTVMHHRQSTKSAEEKLDFLGTLTNSVALLPFRRNSLELIENDGIFIYKEHPRDTYKRVIAHYANNIIPETHQKEKLLNGEDFEKTHSITSKETNNINIVNEIAFFKPRLHQIITEVYESYRYTELVDYLPEKCPGCNDLNFSYAKNYFTIHEAMVEKILEFLETRRFFPDKSNQFLPSLHDTTHAIYAAYCDIFVTNDKKLKEKVGAVYQWLGIKTTLLNAEEFIDYVSNKNF